MNDPQGRIGLGSVRDFGGDDAIALATVAGHVFVGWVVTAAVEKHFNSLRYDKLVIGLSSTVLVRSRGISYVSSGFKGESLLRIGPDVSVASEIVAQVGKRLPCEHHGAILWSIQKGPMHGLGLADSGRAQQVFHSRLGRHHMHVRVAIPRDQVHMRDLK